MLIVIVILMLDGNKGLHLKLNLILLNWIFAELLFLLQVKILEFRIYMDFCIQWIVANVNRYR